MNSPSATDARRKVLIREVLWTGIVKMPIPRSTDYCESEIEGQGHIKYLRFVHSLCAGVVAFHVRGEKPQYYLGQRMYANAEVCLKEYDDGSQGLYVDLFGLEGDGPASIIRVLNVADLPERYARAKIIRAPAPQIGAIVIIPPGSDQ